MNTVRVFHTRISTKHIFCVPLERSNLTKNWITTPVSEHTHFYKVCIQCWLYGLYSQIMFEKICNTIIHYIKMRWLPQLGVVCATRSQQLPQNYQTKITVHLCIIKPQHAREMVCHPGQSGTLFVGIFELRNQYQIWDDAWDRKPRRSCAIFLIADTISSTSTFDKCN